MKRNITLIYILLFTVANAFSQARLLSNKEEIDCGQIEWNHPTTIRYEITNTGDEPLVLTEVLTSCACVVGEWTKEPIAPGEKGFVSALFDAKTLGFFDKSVTIYSNAEPHLVRLHFNGEVVRHVTDFSNTHPYKYNELRVNAKQFDFGDVHSNEKKTIKFSLVNENTEYYQPILMHLPEYISMESDLSALPKGERTEIALTLDASKVHYLGEHHDIIYLSRFAGDKVSSENQLSLSFLLLPNVEPASEVPTIKLSNKEIDLRAELESRDKRSYKIDIDNVGTAPLKILRAQVFNPAIELSINRLEIYPNESTTLKLTVRKRVNASDDENLKILLITNDPNHQKIEINVKR